MAGQIATRFMRVLGGIASDTFHCRSLQSSYLTKHLDVDMPETLFQQPCHQKQYALTYGRKGNYQMFRSFHVTRSHNQGSKVLEEGVVELNGVPLKGKDYKAIKAEVVENETVGVVLLNRPKNLNALSQAVMQEVVDAYKTFDSLPQVGAIVITGQGKAFAAGVDINELKEHNLIDAFVSPFIFKWSEVATIQKPIIAAVNGYALGGGCEVAMMSDIILVGENAVFGQPEVKLAAIPGMGGTQRLIREVGKSRAMEMILTGKFFLNAEEACQRGLASRLVPGTNQALLAEAITLAKTISELSRPVVIMAKAAVNAAYEMGLHEGVKKERDLFGATFGLDDNKEGMCAFLEKRKAIFKNR